MVTRAVKLWVQQDGQTLCLAALKRVSELSVESLLILFIKDLKLMGGCFQLLYGKCSSVLPSEVQGSIGSRVYFGCYFIMGSPSCMVRT